MKSCLLCLLCSFIFFCVSDARGDLFTIPVSGDRYVKKTNAGTTTVEPEDLGGLIVGKIGNQFPQAVATSVGVLPFEFPSIPVGHVVVGANLSFSAHRFGPQFGAPSVDLYGLDFRTTGVVEAGDYYHNPGMIDNTNAALIQAAILSPGVGTGPPFFSFETDATADSALVDYLNNQITDLAFAGDFVFLRFNVDDNQSGDPQLYRIGSSAGSLGAVLTVITAVPEPSAFLFGTLACVVFGVRSTRRERRRNVD